MDQGMLPSTEKAGALPCRGREEEKVRRFFKGLFSWISGKLNIYPIESFILFKKNYIHRCQILDNAMLPQDS